MRHALGELASAKTASANSNALCLGAVRTPAAIVGVLFSRESRVFVSFQERGAGSMLHYRRFRMKTPPREQVVSSAAGVHFIAKVRATAVILVGSVSLVAFVGLRSGTDGPQRPLVRARVCGNREPSAADRVPFCFAPSIS